MKKFIKQKNGITLVALVITIIVLLILAGVTIAMITGENGILNKAKQAKQIQEEKQAEEQDILSDYEAQMSGGLETYNESKKVNNPKLCEGMIPIKWNGTNWEVCKADDPEWFDYDGEKRQWANVMLSDGATDKEVGDIVTEEELGSMFVWIPRYAYSIKEYHTEKDGTEGQAKVGITDVSFLKGTTNSDGNKTYGESYDVNKVEVGKGTEKIVHPAFNFGGKRLTGIWVAKFEASMKEENTNTSENNNVTDKTIKILPNKDSWRYIQIRPIVTNCLNMKNEGNPYKIANVDSHLIKNTEWGAIAYLSASQYGYIPTINNNREIYTEGNTKKYHAYTGGRDYKNNVSQSTTGNITGIYDTNGGAWEYVAAYWNNGSNYLSSLGGTTYFPNNKLNTEYIKYWDKYEVSTNEIEQMAQGLWDKGTDANPIREQIATERYNLMKNKIGDALYETINTYSYYGKNSTGEYGWRMGNDYEKTQYGRNYYNQDYVLIGNDRLSFLARGGTWSEGTGAGVFALYSFNGSEGDYRGFRPVLVY